MRIPRTLVAALSLAAVCALAGEARAQIALETPARANKVEGLLVRYQESRDPALLLEARQQLTAIVGEAPRYTYATCLSAFASRLAGEGEAAREALGRLRPESRAVCSYYFGVPPEDRVLAALRCNYVNSCASYGPKATMTRRDPFHYVKEAPAKIRCGGVTVDPRSCPEGWEAVGRLSWPLLGEDRLEVLQAKGAPPEVEELLRRMGVREGMTVADVGAGTGFYTFPLARAVGSQGKVYALEVEKGLTDLLEFSAREQTVANVTVRPITLSGDDLPRDGVDLIFIQEIASLMAGEWAIQRGGVGMDPAGSAPGDETAALPEGAVRGASAGTMAGGKTSGGGDATGARETRPTGPPGIPVDSARIIALLKNLRPALKPGGKIVIADQEPMFAIFVDSQTNEPLMEKCVLEAGLSQTGDLDLFSDFIIRTYERSRP